MSDTHERQTEVKTTQPTPPGELVVSELAAETILVPIVGTAPLIMHRWSEKARRDMLDNMMKVTKVEQPLDPQAECLAHLYQQTDGSPGMPVLAFKQATVGACRFYKGVTMTALRQTLFMRGKLGRDGQQLVPIEGAYRMREDWVRLRGTTGLRYRPEFAEWSTALEVTFVTTMLRRDSVLSLIDAGGMGVGVGDWRPERDGEFGTYRVDPTREITVLG